MSTIEPDDRVICCPECRSVFEAEDDTLVDVEAIVAARLASVKALADEWDALLHERGPDVTTPTVARCVDALRAVLGSDAHTEQKGTGGPNTHTAGDCSCGKFHNREDFL